MSPEEAAAAVTRLRPVAVRWAASYVHEQDAEDVAQTALALLLQRADVVEPDRVEAYLRTVVWRTASTHRRGRREVLVSELPEQAAVGDPEVTLRSQELSRAVQEALARLPASRRDVVTQVHLEGRSQPDVAAELGAPESTVRVRAEAGLADLRGDLQRQRVAERRRTGGHSSWSVVALGWWQRVERRLRVTGVRRLVAAFGAIALGGEPPTYPELGPTSEELPARVVAAEPLVQPAAAWAERGVERPVMPARQRARHDVPAHMLRQRLTR